MVQSEQLPGYQPNPSSQAYHSSLPSYPSPPTPTPLPPTPPVTTTYDPFTFGKDHLPRPSPGVDEGLDPNERDEGLIPDIVENSLVPNLEVSFDPASN